MKDYFIRLFEYDKTVNVSLADEILKIDAPPEKCKKLLFHIGAAMLLWYNRTTNQIGENKSLFKNESTGQSRKLLISSADKWIKFLSNIEDDDLQNVINYKNLKGKDYVNKIEDIVTQLITHSHYHRGQINQLLRDNGYEPVPTDYIFYLRK